ncbi:helix-turn-helix transcriptional regulator [Dactylosporangium sp. NPDC000555]|uniref:helix-turn-helix domain-containing protein n=1 Tax=Dactylosporangium sp. NPDC000555 TaxID=3154260 RepID=UPI00332EBEBD
MPSTSPDVRRAAFSRFVRRLVDGARQNRGWSVTDIAEETKKRAAGGEGRVAVSRSTLFRWLDGDWKESPSADAVEAFCDVLDVPVLAAFAILWPGKTGRAQVPEPVQPDPDFEVILRNLQDPNVSEQEKYLIRETIRNLASRSAGRRSTGS